MSRLYVDAANTSGIEDGTFQYPYNTVVEAVETAVEYDTISVAPGIYYGRINVPLSMNIVSQQGPEVTVLDGAGDYVGIFYKDIN